MTETIVTSDLEVIEDMMPYNDPDDGKDHLTHIVRPADNYHVINATTNPTSRDIVDLARMGRIEITALCGYKFIPERNPDKYPACQACFEVAGHIMAGG